MTRRVRCTIEEVELKGDYGPVDGVEATCSRCEHAAEAFGTHAAAIRRALVTLREECPNHEDNFYFDEEGNDA